MSDGRSVVQAPAAGHSLRARRLGIDTQFEAVVFMRKDCAICRSEGFAAHNRLLLRAGERHVIATSRLISLLTTRPHYRNQPGAGLTLRTATPLQSAILTRLNPSVTSGAESTATS
jgi:hypothetical protein